TESLTDCSTKFDGGSSYQTTVERSAMKCVACSCKLLFLFFPHGKVVQQEEPREVVGQQVQTRQARLGRRAKLKIHSRNLDKSPVAEVMLITLKLQPLCDMRSMFG